MKEVNLLTIVLTLVMSGDALACLALVNPTNTTRSSAQVKHFYENQTYEKIFRVENIDKDDPCHFEILPTELIQKADGRYQYLPSRPGLLIERSATPYFSLSKVDGSNALETPLTLEAGEIVNFYFNENFPNDKRQGSYHAALQFKLRDYPSTLILNEFYYTFEDHQPQLELKNARFSHEAQRLQFDLINTGNAYTFFKIELTFVDPVSGFQSSQYLNSQERPVNFQVNIRNYPLARNSSERVISSSYSLKNYLRLFKDQLTKQGHSIPSRVITILTPRYGIDFQGWERHYQRTLPRQTLELRLR